VWQERKRVRMVGEEGGNKSGGLRVGRRCGRGCGRGVAGEEESEHGGGEGREEEWGT